MKVSNTTSPIRLSMMFGVGLGYVPRPPSCGPLAGDGSGVSPSMIGAGRRFSAGRAGTAAGAGHSVWRGLPWKPAAH